MRERSSDTERDALCHALVRVVDQRGWTGTSPNLVAAEAGLPAHSFYDSFRSLEECFVAVYDRMLVRITRTATRAVATRTVKLGRAAWQEQLDAILGSVLLFFSVEPALARTCVVEGLAAGPAARARRGEALERFTAWVEALRLTHGAPMPPLAAEMIVLGTVDLIYTRVARGEAERLPELLPQLRRLWWRSVAEHQAPSPALAS